MLSTMTRARKEINGSSDGYFHRTCRSCGADMPSTAEYEGPTTCSPACAAEASAAAKFGVDNSKTVSARAIRLAQIKAKNAKEE